jgi:cytochrome c biogenesis factor
MIKYVLKVVVNVVTLLISTILIIFLSHSRIYKVKNVKKNLTNHPMIFLFCRLFICLRFYSVVMMLLCELGFGFVIMIGVGIELFVHIGHEINDQYHYPFYLAIHVGLCLFIARATIHYSYNERLEIKEQEQRPQPTVRQRAQHA